MADAAGRPDPVTITAHYLSPGKPGPLIEETEVVKAGKRFSTVRGTVRRASDGVAAISVLGTFGDHAPAGALESPTLVHSVDRKVVERGRRVYVREDSGGLRNVK